MSLAAQTLTKADHHISDLEMHDRYADYVEGPIDSYRKQVFEQLIGQISGGTLCDLGSHSVAHYLALGYAHKVTSYECYDVLDRALDLQAQAIDALNIETAQDKYASTISYLCEQSINSDFDLTERITAIIENFDGVRKFDFLQNKADDQFNTVLALGSLEIVDTEDEFQTAIQTAKSLLKPDGKLLAQIVPYGEKTDLVNGFCNAGLDGGLNPDENMIRTNLEKADFSSLTINRADTEIGCYPYAYFITAQR
jgi:SAM-dependent methyltransferase